jgi:hypothetical protein
MNYSPIAGGLPIKKLPDCQVIFTMRKTILQTFFVFAPVRPEIRSATPLIFPGPDNRFNIFCLTQKPHLYIGAFQA